MTDEDVMAAFFYDESAVFPYFGYVCIWDYFDLIRMKNLKTIYRLIEYRFFLIYLIIDWVYIVSGKHVL